MKKGDLILLGLYVALLVFLLGYITVVMLHEKQGRIEAMEYIKELYKKPVSTVVVKGNPSNIKIERENNPLPKLNGFELAGSMFVREINCFEIQGDTLVIKGGSKISELVLHLDPNVRLDTITNKPNVKR